MADAQPMLTGERQVAIDLACFRVYQRRRAGLAATDQIGPAPTGHDLFEYHGLPLSMKVAGAYAGCVRLCNIPA
jgi:hypothetical protein